MNNIDRIYAEAFEKYLICLILAHSYNTHIL